MLEKALKLLQVNGPGSPESGNTLQQRLLAIFLLIIVAAGICYVNYRQHFNGFLRNDNHEYCQIARNFYDGNGYSTSVLRPMAYKYFQTLPQPEATRMPLYPYFLSLFFRIMGPNDISVIVFNSLFFVIMIILTFLIALELSQDIGIGIMAGLLTVSMEAFFRDTITAEPNIFFTTCFLAFIYGYIRYPGRLFVHGITLAALYLVRANTLFVFAGFCLSLFVTGKSWKERLRGPVILTAGFAAGLLPYMVRNYLAIGKPFFSLYSYSFLLMTREFPLYTIWTIIPKVDPSAYVFSHAAEMLQKAYRLFYFTVDDFITVYKPFFLILLGTGLALPVSNPRLRFMRFVILAGSIIQTLVVLPVGAVAYYYVFFCPLAITVVLISVKAYLRQYTVIGSIAVLIVLSYGSAPYWKADRGANPFPSIGKQIAALTEKDDIILTDVPWEVAWYANRRTIWLPYDLDTLKTISTTLKPTYIFVVGFRYAPYKDNIWHAIAQSPEVAAREGYRPVADIRYENRPVGPLLKALN